MVQDLALTPYVPFGNKAEMNAIPMRYPLLTLIAHRGPALIVE
jgi:hypothetical protein